MLKQIRPFVYLILLLPAALLLLVTLFGVRSFKCWLRWWGIPFLFVGLIAGGLAVIALPLLDWGTAMMLARDRLSVSAFSSNLLQTALNLGRSVVREYVGALGLQAALIGLSGFGMLLFSFFIRSKPKAQRLRRVA
jgi:hypothetical protein